MLQLTKLLLFSDLDCVSDLVFALFLSIWNYFDLFQAVLSPQNACVLLFLLYYSKSIYCNIKNKLNAFNV